MTITIYHNPRCSKSRKTLELIRERGIEPRIVEYLRNPLPASTTLELASMLGVRVAELLRTGEDDYNDDTRSLDDRALASWLEEHPRVLQRPIVVDEERKRACIGRPPENVLALLEP